jgi:hypothetical protein
VYLLKLRALLTSRRFQAAVVAMVVSAMGNRVDISPETVREIVAVLCIWIVGDSLKDTTDLWLSEHRNKLSKK